MQNKIGVSTSNTAAGNSGDGIYLGAFAPRTIIGSIAPNTSNLIARNGGAGVRVAGADDTGIEIRGNQITGNVAKGIAIESGANNSIAAPVITGVSPVQGT